MSKKEKRRAARQAFPKAKSPPAAASRGRYAGGARGRTTAGGARSRAAAPGRGGGQGAGRTSAAGRGRGPGGGQALRPPTIKKAVITGAILAFLYFALIEWGWKSGSTTKGNALLSFILFFLYAGVAYGTQRFTYRRKLNRMKGSSK